MRAMKISDLRLWFVLGLPCAGGACAEDGISDDSSRSLSLQAITVAMPVDLPPCTRGHQGDVYYVASDALLYACVSQKWVPIPAGPAGKNALVKSTQLGEGSSGCPTGGTSVQIGLDSNGNGLLDAAEVRQTSFVCNGAQGAVGPAGPAGSQGPAGATGPQGDAGAQGQPGSAGHTSLVRLSPEADGAHCAAGGQRIDVGLDANDNGSLDPGEVQQTEYVCNGISDASICPPGHADCDFDPENGCEAALASDPLNCGACRSTCATPNAAATCSAGRCLVGACTTGYADCDQLTQTGCEVALNVDAHNCGACGRQCGAVANAVTGCSAGQCTVGSCTQGYGDCDNLSANGCEAALNVDTRNCGACGRQCGAVANAVAACSAGLCVVGACVPGYQDCDHLTANGCETPVGTPCP